MISVQQAIQLIKENTRTTCHIQKRTTQEALDFVLAEEMCSPITMPPFRQSAMDGYAIRLHPESTYALIGEIQAGSDQQVTLKAGEAVRIFTGAPVPDTANAVVIQEKTTVKNNVIYVQEMPSLQANIRPVGEQIKQGDVALKKGTKLNAAGIGFLSSLGITQVQVYKKPKVAVIATGNELIIPGKPLTYGKIYESNAIMLQSALQKTGFKDVSRFHLTDDYQETLLLLKTLSQEFDVILLSGGISVGDYDFVGKAMEELQVEQVFYKVKQKPGKPLYFGKKAETYFFGLPGNPASTLSCYYNYVIPVLEIFQGNAEGSLPKLKAQSLTHYTKRGTRAQFLKGFYQNGKVTILEGQTSSMLHTFALANALVFLPEDQISIEVNQRVEVICLPI